VKIETKLSGSEVGDLNQYGLRKLPPVITFNVLGDSLTAGYTRRCMLWPYALTSESGGALLYNPDQSGAEAGYSIYDCWNPAKTDHVKTFNQGTADIAIMQLGTNGLPGAWTTVLLDEWKTLYRDAIAGKLHQGKTVFCLAIAKKFNGDLVTIPTAVLETANAAIQQICLETGAHFIDIYSLFPNATLANYLETADTTHWNGLGVHTVARAIWQKTRSVCNVPSGTIFDGVGTFAGTTAARGLLHNGSLAQIGGFGSGEITSLVRSNYVDPDGSGVVTRCVAVATASGIFSGNHVCETPDVVPAIGDWVLGTCEIRASAATGGSATKFPGVLFRMRGSSNPVTEGFQIAPQSYPWVAGGDTGWVRVAMLRQMKAGQTAMKLQVSTEPVPSDNNGVSWGLTTEVRRLKMWNLTDRGIVI
jgi:hypothetical protein